MARERVYGSNAERQAAYRERHRQRERPTQRRLAQLGQELHARLRDAIATGEAVLPAAVLGKQADETLINLMRYVRGVLPEESKEKEP
jgi:hypothetical protein